MFLRYKLNKRPVGHIADMRNSYKSINTSAQSNDHTIIKNYHEKKNCALKWPFI